jgi:hypothetical protein
MSGMKPSFITGANAKIQLGGKTFAYASDVAYQVAVDTIPVETMGRYEAVSNEPVNYSVRGNLSVVRYTAIAGGNKIPGATSKGNGLGNATDQSGNQMSDQIDPGNLLFSTTWDLAVYQKVEASAAAGGAVATTTATTEFIKITDCRFTSKSAELTKRGLMVDRFSFVGILAMDDSFTAATSGDDDFSS